MESKAEARSEAAPEMYASSACVVRSALIDAHRIRSRGASLLLELRHATPAFFELASCLDRVDLVFAIAPREWEFSSSIPELH